jgi:hypothetical protein
MGNWNAWSFESPATWSLGHHAGNAAKGKRKLYIIARQGEKSFNLVLQATYTKEDVIVH